MDLDTEATAPDPVQSEAVEATPIQSGTEVAGTAEQATPTGEQPAGAEAQSSLPTEKTQQQIPATETPGQEAVKPLDPVILEKRLKDQTANSTRLWQQHQALQNQLKRFEGIDPDRVKQMMEQQQKQQEMVKLKPWNSGHPEYGRFSSLREKASFARNLLSKATPETRPGIEASLQGSFSPQDISQLQEWEAHDQNVRQKLAEDPEGFIAEKVSGLIGRAFEQFEQYQAAKQNSQKWLTAPEMAPLVDKYAQQMDWVMNPEVPARDKAAMFAKLLAESEAYKTQMAPAIAKVSQAEAQQANQRVRATGKRETAPATAPEDLDAEMKTLGIKVGSDQYYRFLAAKSVKSTHNA